MATIERERKPNYQSVAGAQRAIAQYHHQRFSVMVPNGFIGSVELDFAGIRKSGYLDEFEVKLSRADFLADFRKIVNVKRIQPDPERPYLNIEEVPKHEAVQAGRWVANYFHFVIKEGIVTPGEVPEQYGLIVLLDKGGYRIVRDAKLLHKRKVSDDLKLNLAMKLHWRWWDSFKREFDAAAASEI